MTLIVLLIVVGLSFAVKDRWMSRGAPPGDSAPPQEHARYLAIYMRRHRVTFEALSEARAGLAPEDAPTAARSHTPGEVAVRLFSWLGALFVLGGLAAYMAMFWAVMTSFMRVFVTLGFGLGLSALSASAMKEGRHPRLILPLILLAAPLETSGWFVCLHEYFHLGKDLRKAALIVFSIMALQQGLVYLCFRRTSLLSTALFFVYAALATGMDLAGMPEPMICLALGLSLLSLGVKLARMPHAPLAALAYLIGAMSAAGGLYDYLGEHWDWPCAGIIAGAFLFCLGTALKRTAQPQRQDGINPVSEQALMLAGIVFGAIALNTGLWQLISLHMSMARADVAVGVCLCFLGYGLARERNEAERRLGGLFYFAGSAIGYGGLFTLVRHTPFELLYLAVAVAMMYGHIVLESRAILLTSTIAILGFIGYYTTEHFVHQVGWPVSLMLIGVACLGTSAWGLRIAKRAGNHAV